MYCSVIIKAQVAGFNNVNSIFAIACFDSGVFVKADAKFAVASDGIVAIASVDTALGPYLEPCIFAVASDGIVAIASIDATQV